MCTVSFLPKGGNDFILTSNRDEKDSREVALHPKEYIHQHSRVIYPQDPRAKGTWVACADSGFCLCLLNGGFVYHKSKPPYRVSRGVVLLDFFKFNNVNQFLVNYNFKNIEPFTLVIVEFKSSLNLYEVRWDGKQAHLSYKDSKLPHFWSSVTLYTPEDRQRRESWFEQWKGEHLNHATPELIQAFHKTAGDGDLKTNLMMRKDETQTVSITQVVKSEGEVMMNYSDIKRNTTSSVVLNYS